jgi:TPR repeat protein
MGEASGAAAGIGIAVFLIGGGIYCLANTDDCFLDEEVQRARVEAFTASQATFSEGLRRHRAGDPEGLALICLSAQEGYAQAQYTYGAQLLRQEPHHTEEAKMWLQRAALQGHSQADLLLRANGRPSNPPGAGATSDGSTANTPITCPFETALDAQIGCADRALYARITENVWLDAEDPVTFKAVANR